MGEVSVYSNLVAQGRLSCKMSRWRCLSQCTVSVSWRKDYGKLWKHTQDTWKPTWNSKEVFQNESIYGCYYTDMLGRMSIVLFPWKKCRMSVLNFTGYFNRRWLRCALRDLHVVHPNPFRFFIPAHDTRSVLSWSQNVSLNKHKPAARRPTCEWWDSFTLTASVWNSVCRFTYRPVLESPVTVTAQGCHSL
jgi:hypothetical protein